MRAVPEQKRDLVWSSFPSAMAAEISRAATQVARRALLESVPESHGGKDMRARVEVLARWLYRRKLRGR